MSVNLSRSEDEGQSSGVIVNKRKKKSGDEIHFKEQKIINKTREWKKKLA